VTKKQVQRAVERHMAHLFPDLRAVGDLLVARNDPLLRGFSFERSQLDKFSFRLRVFVQMLSVPEDTVTFDLSRELGDFSVQDGEEEAFGAAAEAAQDEGNSFLLFRQDCRSLLEGLDSAATATSDGRLVREVRCHCLILSGNDQAALQEMHGLEDELSPVEVPYEQAALDRVSSLRTAVESSHDEAVALLERWTVETVSALDLDDLDDG